MYQLLTLNNIAPKGLNQLPSAQYTRHTDYAEPDAILLRSYKLTEAMITPSTLAIVRAGAGTNNIPVDVCTERGIPVFNTPGANANAVNELVMTALGLVSRHVLQGMAYVNTLKDMEMEAMHRALEAEKKRFKGKELAGKTLGVIGLGAIGSLIAETALNLHMQVAGYDPALSVAAAWRLPSRVKKVDDLATLVSQCDFISLHLPMLDSTRHMIDKKLLQSFKKDSCLLNFAREGIVDSDAVAEALANGHLGAYISDFPTPRLLEQENAILMPHIGASTEEAEENCAVMAVEQLRDFLENGNITHSVNFPSLFLERSEGIRLAVTNNNVPKILGTLLSLLADQNLNIVDMINKSRTDIAYNLIDIDAQPTDALLHQIAELDGVMGVRLVEKHT